MFTRERVGIYILYFILYTYMNVLHMEEYEMKWNEGEFFRYKSLLGNTPSERLNPTNGAHVGFFSIFMIVCEYVYSTNFFFFWHF